VRHSPLVALLAGLTVVGPTAAHPLGAQTPRLVVTAPPKERATVEGPRITTTGVLGDSKLQQFIRSGFPARLHYRIELWTSKQGFDTREAGAEWVIIVAYDQLQHTYTIRRQAGDRLIASGPYQTIAEVEAAIATPMEAPIRAPASKRRFYYHAVLEIEKVSVSDLDELNAWLSGELRPATRGERNPGTSFARGLKTLMLRMLGGENPRYEARSGTFETG
jgi:hypothetical protein